LSSLNILANIPYFLLSKKPSFRINILKSNIFTRISLITSHYNRKEYTIPNPYILKLYVCDIDSWLSLASTLWIKWIEHASWTSLIWLFLLLRAEIDRPPYRLMHRDVLVKNVVDKTVSILSRISL
jgi:hypothetical protein